MTYTIQNSRKALRYDRPPVTVRATAQRGAVPAPAIPAPADFIRAHVRIDNAQPGDDAPSDMSFDLWPAQDALLADMHAERLLLILKARQLGASWLALAYALWLCLYHGGRLVLVFSIGQDEANEMLRRAHVMYWRLPADLRATLPALIKDNTEEMAWANGARILSLPARKTAGSGYTASLVILDEFAKNERATAIYTAVKPTIDGGGKMLILSTAQGTGNLFHDLVAKARAGVSRFAFRFLPWTARPDRDAAWYAAVAADAVDMAHMRQEYPATPEEAFEATEVDAFLPDIALWDACRADLPPLDRHTPVVLALDAGESSDTFATVLVSRTEAGVAARYARAYVPAGGAALDFDAIEHDIRALLADHAVRELVYDPMLLGQMIRRLTTGPRALPIVCTPFPQGAARLIADKGLSDLIMQRRIAHDGSDALRAHIANANKRVSPDGRSLRIIKREHAKKIDLAVALAMGAQRAGAVLTPGWTPDDLAKLAGRRV